LWGSGDLTAEFDALFEISVPIEPDALVEISVLIFGRLATPQSLPHFPVPEITASEHRGVCRTLARIMSGGVLYQIVDVEDGIRTLALPPMPRVPSTSE
jgi:hypothetical protein